MSREESPKLETVSEEYPHTESRGKNPDLNMILKPGSRWSAETTDRRKLPGSFLPVKALLLDNHFLHFTRWTQGAFVTESETPWS